MNMTRRQLADAIDDLDAQIKTLNTAKADEYKLYRRDLEDGGMDARRAAAELAATKAAIAKRQKLNADPDAVRERDELIDEILDEILVEPSRARGSALREVA